MNAGGDILRVEGLSVRFSRWGQQVRAVDSVGFRVPRGQWVAVLGHNGSGKSTLLKTIGGMLRADEGRVHVGGRNVIAMSRRELAGAVFYVYQDPSLGTAPTLTVMENLLVADHAAQCERTPKHLLTRKYQEMLEPLGLGGRLRQPALTLSGGERQLLALLIARLRPAPLILLDEPLAALDPSMAELCTGELYRLREQGRTLLVVTHDHAWAATHAARTLEMRAGRIVSDTQTAGASASHKLHSVHYLTA